MIPKNSFVASSSAIASSLSQGFKTSSFHDNCSFVRAMCKARTRYEGYLQVSEISPLTAPEAS